MLYKENVHTEQTQCEHHIEVFKVKPGGQQIGLKFEEETSKMLHLEHGFVWC